MSWPHYRETVTVVDVLGAGACWEGVRDHLKDRPEIAGPTAQHAGNEHILLGAHADGYGDGSGSGDGYGDGYGDGSGYGSGYGYGDGSGSGDGYGYGSGDG